MVRIITGREALHRIAAELAHRFEGTPTGCFLPFFWVVDDRLTNERARVRIGMPQSGAKEALLWCKMKIEAGSMNFFPGLMREARGSHRLIRRLIFAKTHVAINTQERAAERFRIGNEVRA